MLYFYNQNQTLYPGFYDYSYNLILNKLADLITAEGGRVQPHKFNTGFIKNRSHIEKISEKKQDLESFLRFNKTLFDAGKFTAEEYERRTNNLKENYKKEIEELEKVPNEPQKVNYPDYITFILDGFYYNISYSDAQYSYVVNKQPVKSGGIVSKDIYSEKISSYFLSFVSGEMFSNPTEYAKGIEEGARHLLETVKRAKPGKQYREGYKRRVNNTYNTGYHYETIYKPERTEKIDF